MSALGVERAIQRAGRVEKLPLIDGPVVERFEPRALASALEQEVQRAMEVGWPKISLHMDVADAKKLALYLIRG